MMRILSLLFAWGILLPFAHAFEHNTPLKPSEKVQVLLEKEVSEALLEVKGPYYVFNPKDGSRVTSGLLGKRFLVHAKPTGIKWGEEFLGIHQIYVIPRSEDHAILVNGIQYEGAVAIYAVDGKISIVNDIDIESYVKACLSTQFPYPHETEVMSALAILARTNAYFQTIKNRKAFWHIDAKSQGYFGCALNTKNSYIEKIVDTTKNLILTQSKEGQRLPFPAAWTEHSAGVTAPFSTIFRQENPFSEYTVDAPHAKVDRDDSKWQFSLTKQKLSNLFSQPVKDIELFIDKKSKKAYGVRLSGQGRQKDLSFFEFQQKIGKNLLQSSDFIVQVKGQKINFTGYGKGHGVGLCLYSASAMAQNGDNALEILKKFFPGAELLNLKPLPPMMEIGDDE